LSFSEFVELVTTSSETSRSRSSTGVVGDDPSGLGAHTEAHWRPQSMMCGMDYLLPHVDFIGSFEHIAQHTRLLLEKVGLWEE
jgi:hypothetical protein